GTARVLGRVTDDAGRPVPGATVVVVTGGARAPGGQARSEDTGGFQLAALPAGSYRLRVEKVGYAPQEQDVVLGDGEQRTVVLRLQTARASRTVQAQRAMLPQRRP
ncbi:MAG: TonB-dependent outer membrane protein SusC/RagA, partial [Gemmatimonadetes bacterium]|nr:TonB-dependent outer membrane protein SusC/RagA [Gemmatimonadota bacterium]